MQFLKYAGQERLDVGLLHFLFVDGLHNVEKLFFAHIGSRWQALALENSFAALFDLADFLLKLHRDDADGHAKVASAARTATAVGINFGLVGQAVVDHVADLAHVDAPGGHIGGDEQLEVAFAETLHHAVAVGLRQVAVQGFGVVAVADHLLGNFLGFNFGAAENESVDTRIGVYHAFERGKTVVGPADVIDVFNVGVAFIGHPGADLHRILHVALGDGPHIGRHGSREKPGGLASFCGRQDGFDGFAEAHVQHFVGFVEHHTMGIAQAKRLAVEHVDEAAWSGHHNLSAGLDLADLTFDARAAVHGHHFVLVGKLGVALQVERHLHAELAGGAQHEGLHAPFVRVDALEQGQAEGGGFAGAGLCQGNDVLLGFQRGRNNKGLYGRGDVKSQCRDAFEQIVLDTQVLKSSHVRNNNRVTTSRQPRTRERCSRF